MVSIIKAPELTIQQYVASLNLNPANVFYQRVHSTNVNTAGVQWQITSPNKRSLLLSWAAIDYEVTIEKQTNAEVATAFRAGDQVSFKPLLPFTQAMTSQTVSVNGNSLTISQPRRFAENMCRMAVGKSESRACYESGWWDNHGGNYCTNRSGLDQLAEYVDPGMRANEEDLRRKMVNSIAIANPPLQGATAYTISYQEPVFCPPFNPFSKVSGASMPDYLPYKWMSPVLPNIDRIELDIQFNSSKLAASTLFYRYGVQQAAAGVTKNVQITALDAHILLYWYEVDPIMSIPRSVDLQTWNIREFQTSLGDLANPAVVALTATDLLQLRSVPSYIIIHARRNHDADDYRARAMVGDDDFRGTGGTGSTRADGTRTDNANHSLDTHCEITSMNVVLGDRPNVISTQFTQRELYLITLKNCKYGDFSLNFNDWAGSFTARNITADNNLDRNPLPTAVGAASELEIQFAKSFVVLQPKDIAQQVSAGVFFPTSLQFTVAFNVKDGACGMRGGTHGYTMFTHIVVGKHMLRLEPDRAAFQEQSMTIDAADAALRGSSSSLGGALSTGGALSNLRQRVSTGYQARF